MLLYLSSNINSLSLFRLTTFQEKEAAREAAKQQKQQQEAQKQLKAIEQKREKERKLKAELAEAAKQERDLILSKKIADEKAYLEQMKNSKKEEPKLTFDMLETDDSTDDEDTASKSRPNRPPPPAWSLRECFTWKNLMGMMNRKIIFEFQAPILNVRSLCKPVSVSTQSINFSHANQRHRIWLQYFHKSIRSICNVIRVHSGTHRPDIRNCRNIERVYVKNRFAFNVHSQMRSG